MWEKAGKPQGADFGPDARKALEDQLRRGETLESLERTLRGPTPQPAAAAPSKAAIQPEAASPVSPELGQSIGVGSTDALALIKPAAPILTREERSAPQRPLSSLRAAAQRDEAIVWK